MCKYTGTSVLTHSVYHPFSSNMQARYDPTVRVSFQKKAYTGTSVLTHSVYHTFSSNMQARYDPRVRVSFQKKAWSDEHIMLGWIRRQWSAACSGNMLLVLDVHKAQKTEDVKALLAEKHTTPLYIPPGCTSIIQPLDVNRLANAHSAENLNAYVQGTIPAGERRVLLTRWVAQAWEEASAHRDMVIRSFRKCGISLPIDGTLDTEINLEGIPDYKVDGEGSSEL